MYMINLTDVRRPLTIREIATTPTVLIGRLLNLGQS